MQSSRIAQWFKPLTQRLRAFSRDGASDIRGVSAIEFALILPVMMTLLFAGAETTTGLQIQRKVTNTARALSDLSSQQATMSNAERDNILNAAADVLAPFAFANAKIIVTGIQIDILGVARVEWSEARNTTAYAKGKIMSVPLDLKPLIGTTRFLVFAEVKYNYVPAVAYLISGSINIADQLYTFPRVGDTVTRTP